MKNIKLTKIIVLLLAITGLFVLSGCHKNIIPGDDDLLDDDNNQNQPVDCEKNPEHESCKDPDEDYPYSRGFTIYELTNPLTGELLDAYGVGKYEGKDTEVIVPAVWKDKPIIRIAASTFEGNDKITKVTIPASVNQMGKNVFANCKALTEVVFENGTELQELPTNTFYECTSLKGITIPSSIREIGEYAFYHCTSINELYIPTTVKKIGKCAFGGMTSLNKLTVPFIGGGTADGADSGLLGYVFNTVYTEFTTPVSQKISDKASRTYYIPNMLKTIEVLESSTKTLSYGALSGITTVDRIILPKSISKFEDNVFYDATGIIDIFYRGNSSDWMKISGRYNEGNQEILESVEVTYDYAE